MRTVTLRLVLVVAIAGLMGALATVAGGAAQKRTMAVSLHANFDSFVSNPTKDCPSLHKVQVLVLGRGVATGAMSAKYKSAVGTAAECSKGQNAGTAIPTLGNCHNIKAGSPFFDVHGKGFYMTPDGSVLHLVYHELSKNPFISGKPPFNLHDCGAWQVDGAASTGIFHGASGTGSISANVPVRADFSAHVEATYAGTITLASGAKSPAGGSVTCNGMMSDRPIAAALHVSKGQTCDLEHSAVNGGVTVDAGGTLIVKNSIIRGNLACDGCVLPTVFYSTTNGLSVTNVPSGTAIIGAVVKGNLTVGNSGGALTVKSSFANNMSFTGNKGKSTVQYDTLAGTLTCSGNSPAPKGSLNFAGGRPATCKS